MASRLLGWSYSCSAAPMVPGWDGDGPLDLERARIHLPQPASMSAILEDPAVRSHLHPIPVATYHRLIELGEFEGAKVELLRGMLIEKTPKSPLHCRIVHLLFERVWEHVREQSGPWLVKKEDPLTFLDSEPGPDLAVVRGVMDDFDHAHPAMAEWVIEVAVSSLAVDRLKVELYAEAGIREYWIVEPELGAVEVYRRLENGRYTETSVLGKDTEISPAAFPRFRFRLVDYLPAN